ncbi:replication factor A [Halodesulfurarchaeum formicicum]|uniref:Replication factor A n=1 Tax=Halodesulfurarchaeum formicicum TaxID=1873524 RepID=A0A1J1A8Z8_9EURY|nr:replication factor A [Halodesulfurarchaeum formicicum]APE94588.1 replication factor A [Halodesulfurarchaeum formicicum]
MSDIQSAAEDIHEEFTEHLDIQIEDVANRLDRLVTEYKVPLSEARRSVENHYLEEAGLEREDLSAGSETEVSVADIDQPEEWVSLTAQVVELWEPRSDAVGQVGLLGDASGTIKFTAWAKSDLESLEEGEVYRLDNVVTDEYQGRYSVKLNKTTEITHLEEEIEVGNNDTTMEGALVDIQSGSGLIKRCPVEDCTRVLQNGRCSEHGDVEGEFDLRIKGVLDDGREVQDVIFDREMTESLTGIDLDEAKQMAQDALDTTVVVDEMEDTLLGRYYSVTGPVMGRYLLANEVEELKEPVDPDDVLIRARSM